VLLLLAALVVQISTPGAICPQTHVRAAPPTALLYSTDFEDVTKKDANRLNMGIDNWFEFEGSGGASMWVEGLDRSTPGLTPHSGSRCVGMELTDISKSRRNEFNILDLENLVGDELFVSVWLYLPADWRLHAPNDWYALVDPFFTAGPSYLPYGAVHVSQPDIKVNVFDLSFRIRDVSGTLRTLGEIADYPVPRGEWFNVQYYVYRHETNGITKVWIDGSLIWDVRNICTKNPSTVEWFTTVAKIYYDTNDKFSPYRIWVDDLEIHNRQPCTVTSVSLNARLDASSSPPTVLISGSIYPAPGRPVNVTLEFSNNQGGTYQEITHVISATDGSFSYSWKAPGTGVFMIRAQAEGVKSFAVSIGTSGVPGFPLESLLVGSGLGLLFVIMRRRQRPGESFPIIACWLPADISWLSCLMMLAHHLLHV
jgi:hypothetical protein